MPFLRRIHLVFRDSFARSLHTFLFGIGNVVGAGATHIAEEFAIQAFVAQLVMKAFNMRRATALCANCLDLRAFSPSCMRVMINSGPLSLRGCSGPLGDETYGSAVGISVK